MSENKMISETESNETVIESDIDTTLGAENNGESGLRADDDEIGGIDATFASLPADGDEAAPDNESVPELPPLPLVAQISALLFVAPRPLTVAQLAAAVRSTEEPVETALDELRSAYAEDIHGFLLYEVGGAFQLRTSPRVARVIHRLIPPRAKKLSRAAAETLAVVAYKQPVQRAEIEAIRGVDALPTIKTLLDARLIRIVGRSHSPGHPSLYGTTTTFLEKFGLRDLSDLPTSREILDLAQDPGESELLDESVSGAEEPETEERPFETSDTVPDAPDVNAGAGLAAASGLA